MNKSIFKNTIFKFILNLFNIIVPILVNTYVYRVFDPDLMGSINFAQTIYGYFFIFAGFGVYQYGLREISRVRDDKKKLSSVFTSLFSITIITNVVTTLIYLLFINKYQGTEVYTACLVLTFSLFSNVFYTEWVNEALENYDFITIKTIIVRVAYIVLLFIFVKTSHNYKEYLILLALSTFLNNIISYVYIRKSVKLSFKNITILPHLKPMLLVVILSNANVLYTQLDKYMLGEFVNKAEVGYYNMAQNVSSMVNALMLTVVYVTIPRLSNYLANKKIKDYLDLLKKISGIYFLLLFPTCIGMILLSKEIVLLYSTPEYLPAIPMLILFSFYAIVVGYEVILSNQIMYLNGKEKQQVKIIFIGGLINLILNILLLKFHVFDGNTATITTVISEGTVVLILSRYVRSHLNIDFRIFSMEKLKYLIVSLIFIPIILILKLFIQGNLLVCLISIPLCALVYFGILLIIKDPIALECTNKGISLVKEKLKK